jgi:hypothetical protein
VLSGNGLMSEVDKRDILLGHFSPEEVDSVSDHEKPSLAQIRSIALNILMLYKKNKDYTKKFLAFYCNRDMIFRHKYTVYNPYVEGNYIADFEVIGGKDTLSDSINMKQSLMRSDILTLKVNSVHISENKREGSAALNIMNRYPIDISNDKEAFVDLVTRLRMSIDENTAKKLQKMSKFNAVMNTSCNFAFSLSATFIVDGMNCLSTMYFTRNDR